MSKTFCYWSVADGKHADMIQATVTSARNVGVTEDFHIWSDKNINGATTHIIDKSFDKSHYLFKLKFLKEFVSKLNYDYFIFLDADTYFVRKPENILNCLKNSPVHASLESDCTSLENKRKDWWGCDLKEYCNLMKEFGVKNKKIYNVNAGFFIVHKDIINTFYTLAMDFWNKCQSRGYKEFTEEPPLAYAIHMLTDNADLHSIKNSFNIWASDWTGCYNNKLPDGKDWLFEDYMSGIKIKVNPAIVHAMRSKDALISMSKNINNSINTDQGFYIGHQMLGDVIGFCAAAHLLHCKTGKIIKIHFEEKRKDLVKYFDGIEWVEKKNIPNAIDCGKDPSLEEWPKMNGVKRFYKFMDKSLTNAKSFDIHFNINKINSDKKIIGLITHSNTQGDIPDNVLKTMIDDAKQQYPNHKIALIGKYDNSKIPEGVEDWRQKDGDINWIIDTIREIDLLITPQSGPCFIAAGFKIPMWVYESKEKFWDYTLNYDTYKVEKWYKRTELLNTNTTTSPVEICDIFNNIYKSGGWNKLGSGEGSQIESTLDYVPFIQEFLEKNNIKSVLDLGCGDWTFSKTIDWSDIKYLGVDASEIVIKNNIEKYKNKNINFKCCNFLKENFGNYDLCIIKDVFQHLKNEEIINFKKQLKKFKYILITNDYTEKNVDLVNNGDYRAVNMSKEPLNFPGKYVFRFDNKFTFLVNNNEAILSEIDDIKLDKKYDILITVLACTSDEKYLNRLKEFKNNGLINTENQNIGVFILIGDDPIPESLLGNWNYDTFFVKDISKPASSKMASFLLRLNLTPEYLPKWLMKIDDDSITDIEYLFSNLNKIKHKHPLYLSSELYFDSSNDIKNIFKKLNINYNKNYFHEWECCIVNEYWLSHILNTELYRNILKEVCDISYNINADHLMGPISNIANIIPKKYDILNSFNNITYLNIFGGNLAHIHFIAPDINKDLYYKLSKILHKLNENKLLCQNKNLVIELVEQKTPITFNDLIYKKFTFIRNDKDKISELGFDGSGKIINSVSDNEKFWYLLDNRLIFTNSKHNITSIFAKINDNLFEGLFFPNVNVKHSLKLITKN